MRCSAPGGDATGDYLQLVAAPAARSPGRVGLVIPKRVLPLAVDRNRVRRMLRAAARRRTAGEFSSST